MHLYISCMSGFVDTERPCREQPWLSEVVLGQMRHLGPGTDDTQRPCREQPWMSLVVLGQMGHLRPGTDDDLIHHVGNNLGCPRLS